MFVAGAGLMGHGIAQVHAAVGKEVTVYEPDLARAEAGIATDRGQPGTGGREGEARRRRSGRRSSPG